MQKPAKPSCSDSKSSRSHTLALAAVCSSTSAADVTWQARATVTDNAGIGLIGLIAHAGNLRSDNQENTLPVGAENVLFKSHPTDPDELHEDEETGVITGSGGPQITSGPFNASEITVSTKFEVALDGSAWANPDPGPAPGAADMVLRVACSNVKTLIERQEYPITNSLRTTRIRRRCHRLPVDSSSLQWEHKPNINPKQQK